MDEHPIPQDVTGFQFKLIGNMTIKQFGYVASGVVIAVILYYMPISILIKILLIPLFGGGGIIIAFVPIEGRPLDVMITNFFRAIFAPNQFIYQKVGRQFSFANLPPGRTVSVVQQQQTASTTAKQEEKHQQMLGILATSNHPKKNKLDEKEEQFLKSLTSTSSTLAMHAPSSSAAIAQPTPQPKPDQSLTKVPATPSPTPTPVNSASMALSKQEEDLTHQLEVAKKTTANQPIIALLERQVQALHFQRQQLEQQLQQLQAQLVSTQKTQQQQAAVAHNIPKEQLKTVGLPHVSDTPNVIVGIVRDSRGNVLPGMLVEVKDKEGNPVRAFKTNQLGQFASATPLATGIYTIELDDPKKQHNFDVVQISASNQILLPIEVVSHDAREELRKELFN